MKCQIKSEKFVIWADIWTSQHKKIPVWRRIPAACSCSRNWWLLFHWQPKHHWSWGHDWQPLPRSLQQLREQVGSGLRHCGRDPCKNYRWSRSAGRGRGTAFRKKPCAQSNFNYEAAQAWSSVARFTFTVDAQALCPGEVSWMVTNWCNIDR